MLEVGKQVKKLLGQEMSLEEVSEFISSTRNKKYTPKMCVEEYQKYMGITPTNRTSGDLVKLIQNKKSIHLWGSTGVGKTTKIRSLAESLELNLIETEPRNEEELISDLQDIPFTEKDALILMEGDYYYWRKYGLIRRYVRDSKCAFVIITTNKNAPNGHVTKHMTQVKMLPPTRSDVASFISNISDVDYSTSEIVKNFYSKDWREVWRNYLYGKENKKSTKSMKEISAKHLTYLLLKGKAEYSDFTRCKHPLSFVCNWLSYNAHKFYKSKKKLLRVANVVSFCDAYKYNYKNVYLKNLLLKIPRMENKSYLTFPPYRKKKKEKEKKKYTMNKLSRKVSKENEKETKTVKVDDIGDFLLI